LGELRDGWHVLRRQPTLFQNTLVSTVAQLSVGTTLALTIVYARDTLNGQFIPYPQNYAAIDAVIGFGNLLGGLVVGAIGSRVRKGWMVVIGFVVMGLATVFLGLTQNVLLAQGAAFVPFNQPGLAANTLLSGSFTTVATLEPVAVEAEAVAEEVPAG